MATKKPNYFLVLSYKLQVSKYDLPITDIKLIKADETQL